MVATAYQHGAGRDGRNDESTSVRRKPVKAGQSERLHRESHEATARHVKTFQKDGDATNGSAGL
jgi:hypothetical protein